MRMSAQGRKMLVGLEGVRLHAYEDSAGHQTIGIGHKLTADEIRMGSLVIAGRYVPYKDGISREDADALFDQDLDPCEELVFNVTRRPLSQNQFDALVSFVFNVGAGAYVESTLLRLLNQGKYDAVPHELSRWVNAGGKRSAGLIARRGEEVALWNQSRKEAA